MPHCDAALLCQACTAVPSFFSVVCSTAASVPVKLFPMHPPTPVFILAVPLTQPLAMPPPHPHPKQHMDIHLLMTLACAGAIALADYSEAAAVVVLFAIAEHWERCSTDKVGGGWGVCVCACWAARKVLHCRAVDALQGAASSARQRLVTQLMAPCIEPISVLAEMQARDAVAAVLCLRPESGASAGFVRV